MGVWPHTHQKGTNVTFSDTDEGSGLLPNAKSWFEESLLTPFSGRGGSIGGCRKEWNDLGKKMFLDSADFKYKVL